MFKKLKSFWLSTEINPAKKELNELREIKQDHILYIKQLELRNMKLTKNLIDIQRCCYRPEKGNLLALCNVVKITKEVLGEN